ncbi:potassium transport protein 1 [Stemphylium lycopersici]|uniref:Potassium transport protein 1 n=1 Tax=Stemphylium lycopersici TaxID=183478 RepID=A0A364N2K9_STELY|nr:potassium transport protein 1 [Stemphylium lycopersici]RAR09934.1 potassium transport protein 1 [Stemphylium lycopersici]
MAATTSPKKTRRSWTRSRATLRPGADLSRVTLPTFILEPRSMLERITNFMAHPETLLPITKVEDPVQRFVAVTKFYLSGWHIKPPGVKKPLNPILGEIFTGYWDYSDGTKGYYIAEQTSHHPPKSSYFFMAPEHHIRIDGTLKPRSKFLGNSAASMMEGIAVLRLLNTGERFFVTQPNMYARGILFGTMKYELGDHAYIRCPETGLSADLEFKTKGYFSGSYNAIGGYIKDSNGKNLFELSGQWNEEMYIKDLTTGKKELLFDAAHTRHTPPMARPMEEQDERESQRLWHDVTEAVKRRDQDVATDAKAKIEDMQRQEAAKRNSEGVDWHPQLFRRVKGGQGGSEEGEEDLDWIINAKFDGKTPEEVVKQILQIYAILPGQKPDKQFNIPSRTSETHQAQTQEPTEPVEQAPTEQSAEPTEKVQPVPFEPTTVQSQPAVMPQHQQQSVGLPSNFDGTATHAPLSKHSSHPTDPSNPPTLPFQKPTSQPDIISPENQERIAKELPPSKLLNSNLAEEAQKDDLLRRKDSETLEDDEFHDAQSDININFFFFSFIISIQIQEALRRRMLFNLLPFVSGGTRVGALASQTFNNDLTTLGTTKASITDRNVPVTSSTHSSNKQHSQPLGTDGGGKSQQVSWSNSGRTNTLQVLSMSSSWQRLDDNGGDDGSVMTDPLDELRNPRKAKDDFVKYMKEEVFKLNFYRAHMLYFIVVIAISSVVVYGQGLADGPEELGGLNPVDLGPLSGYQQATFVILMIVGNIPFVSTAVVLIRRALFRRKMADVVKHSHTMQRLVQDVENRSSDTNDSSGSLRQRSKAHKNHQAKGKHIRNNDPSKVKIEPMSRRRTYHYETGFGFIPTPWETKFARNFFRRVIDLFTSELKPEQHDYISFNPHLDSKGRFRELSEQDRMELGGVEYRALQALLLILIGYQVFWYLFGITFLLPYAYRDNIESVLYESQPGQINPGWWGFFAGVTEFSNGGLNVLNANFVPFSGYPYVLIIAGILSFAGQTQFPIFLRMTIWGLKKMAPKESRFRNTMGFLLQHPRRCFIYLFPSRETLYLFVTQVVIDITAWLCFEILNIGIPEIDALPTGTRILDGLFQATGLRTSGAYIMSISSLAPACLVAYLVIIKTNTYEEKSIGLEEHDSSAAGIASHLQKQLAYDIWFQFFIFFLICIIERRHIIDADPGFSLFSVLFEVTSAYGTVGLSLGVPGKYYSLCGDFASLSKVVLLFAMLRGRHRGLPLAIDRSILLPGEELMHRMDQEYSAKGVENPVREAELRDDIERSGVRKSQNGKGEQNPEGRRLSQPDNEAGRESQEVVAGSNP